MKNTFLVATMVLSFSLLTDGRATADIVYDGGPINGTVTSFAIFDNFSGSNSFTPSAPGITNLTGAQNVGIWLDPGNTVTSVQWAIGTTPFANNISSGTSTPSLVQLTPASNYGDAIGAYVYSASFSLSGAVSFGNTYWLTLQDAATFPTTDDAVYWDQNSGPSTAFENNGFLITSHSGQSFQLVGASVPEPSSLILAGLGAALGCCGWRAARIKKGIANPGSDGEPSRCEEP